MGILMLINLWPFDHMYRDVSAHSVPDATSVHAPPRNSQSTHMLAPLRLLPQAVRPNAPLASGPRTILNRAPFQAPRGDNLTVTLPVKAVLKYSTSPSTAAAKLIV